jgi:hypothetical protein
MMNWAYGYMAECVVFYGYQSSYRMRNYCISGSEARRFL